MSGEITNEVLQTIYAHAREGYPEEICGFVVGTDEARRCENRQNALHAEDPTHFPRDARTAYNIGAKDLFFLDKSQRSGRPVTIIYHSHIDVGSYFSDEDVRAAAPDGELLYPVDYLVVDAQPDRIGGARLYRFVATHPALRAGAQAGKFVEVASYGP